MNRRLFLQVTAPAASIGLLLFLACLLNAWFVDRLHTNRSTILSQNVTSLEAIQELEINLRRLRFLCFLYLVDPNQKLLADIDLVNASFRNNLAYTESTSFTPEELELIDAIRVGYDRYQQDFQRMRAEVARTGPRRNFQELADANPIRHLVEPCDQLLRINKEMMQRTSQDSDRINAILRWAMLLLGVGGPLSGLLLGFGVARGLSRSISRLSVHVQDVAQRLDEHVGAVTVSTDSDLQSLDLQLQNVVHRVEEVAQRLHHQQRALLRAQQLSAVGQLAASVAHEVRNPLTAIKMLVESAWRSRNRKPLTLEDMQVIHGEIARLEHTVQSFLDFARLPLPRRTLTDLGAVVEQALELVRVRARQQGVALVPRLPPQPLRASVDPSQLCTVLVNLFINALDAMPLGGRLEVTLAEAPGGSIQLTVQDTGGGIAPAIYEQLFLPFVSTKPTGSGLGLSISQRILEEHGGRLVGANAPEGGARFTLTLPAPRENLNHAETAGHR